MLTGKVKAFSVFFEYICLSARGKPTAGKVVHLIYTLLYEKKGNKFRKS